MELGLFAQRDQRQVANTLQIPDVFPEDMIASVAPPSLCKTSIRAQKWLRKAAEPHQSCQGVLWRNAIRMFIALDVEDAFQPFFPPFVFVQLVEDDEFVFLAPFLFLRSKTVMTNLECRSIWSVRINGSIKT
jgi:hypothetical protein